MIRVTRPSCAGCALAVAKYRPKVCETCLRIGPKASTLAHALSRGLVG